MAIMSHRVYSEIITSLIEWTGGKSQQASQTKRLFYILQFRFGESSALFSGNVTGDVNLNKIINTLQLVNAYEYLYVRTHARTLFCIFLYVLQSTLALRTPRYYGLSLIRTLNEVPSVSAKTRVYCIVH